MYKTEINIVYIHICPLDIGCLYFQKHSPISFNIIIIFGICRKFNTILKFLTNLFLLLIYRALLRTIFLEEKMYHFFQTQHFNLQIMLCDITHYFHLIHIRIIYFYIGLSCIKLFNCYYCLQYCLLYYCFCVCI